MQPTLLLISSPHLNWVGLRTAVQEWAGIQLLGDASDPSEALQVAEKLHPSLILIDADMVGTEILKLIRQLHEVSTESRILLVGKSDSFRCSLLWGLNYLGLRGYRCWEDLNKEAVYRWLAIVIEDDQLVASPVVAKTCADPAGELGVSLACNVAINSFEQKILHEMSKGYNQNQIAKSNHVSVPTVKRAVASLRERFNACNDFTLGVNVALKGYIGDVAFDP